MAKTKKDGAAVKATLPTTSLVRASPRHDPPHRACPRGARARRQGALTAVEVWSSEEFVQDGMMTQEGFAALCDRLDIEQMSFDACFLLHVLCPEIRDVMVVCSTKAALDRGLGALGCARARPIGHIRRIRPIPR